jgi:hypothetical protein
MFDVLTILTLFAGYILILVVGAKLGAGTDSLAGLFTYRGIPSRPQGVQETDLPPFVFRDARTAPAGA